MLKRITIKLKIYVVSDLHHGVKEFERQIKSVLKPDDTIIFNGDLGSGTHKPASILTYIYIYNLMLQRKWNIVLIRGNHEVFNKHNFKQWVDKKQMKKKVKTEELNRNFKESCFYDEKVFKGKELNLMKVFKKTLKPMLDFFETENFVITHGWINPNWSVKQHHLQDKKNDNQFLIHWDEKKKERRKLSAGFWSGSPSFIWLSFLQWCYQETLDKNDKDVLEKWKLEKDKHYFGFATIEDYMNVFKNKFHKQLIVGHMFNPLNDGNNDIIEKGNCWFIDGGWGYYNLNVRGFKNDKPQLHILDITNKTPFKI